MFRLSQDADINGTSLKDHIMVAPALLIEKFGPPIASDGYKVSGEYVFEKDEGEVFTLYDWKCTDLYDSYGTPSDEFWRGRAPVQFNIGGRSSAFDFVDWLKKECEVTKAAKRLTLRDVADSQRDLGEYINHLESTIADLLEQNKILRNQRDRMTYVYHGVEGASAPQTDEEWLEWKPTPVSGQGD